MFTCDVHMWTSSQDHMWCLYVMYTCDFVVISVRIVHMWCPHVIYRMWFSVCDIPYVMFTCDFTCVHMWCSHVIWPHVMFTCEYISNHMWTCSHVNIPQNHIRFSDEMGRPRRDWNLGQTAQRLKLKADRSESKGWGRPHRNYCWCTSHRNYWWGRRNRRLIAERGSEIIGGSANSVADAMEQSENEWYRQVGIKLCRQAGITWTGMCDTGLWCVWHLWLRALIYLTLATHGFGC